MPMSPNSDRPYTVYFRYRDVDHPILLDLVHAPETNRLLLKTLPCRIDVHCAKIAGRHIFWHAPFIAPVEVGKDILAVPAGTLLYWPERQFLELIYGPLQAEEATVTVLGRLEGDIGWLTDLGRTVAREHGHRILWAELHQRVNRPACISTSGSAYDPIGKLVSARTAIWESEPWFVKELLQREGQTLPYGPLAMAEAELRKLQELLWEVADSVASDDALSIRAMSRFLLEAFAKRLGGLYGLYETSTILTDAAIEVEDPSIEIHKILHELILYCGRLAGWLDLYIPWNTINNVVIESLTAQGIRER